MTHNRKMPFAFLLINKNKLSDEIDAICFEKERKKEGKKVKGVAYHSRNMLPQFLSFSFQQL